MALGAAVFTMAGAYRFADIPTSPNVDPSGVAAQIAAGIGFIGAGAILKIGANVRGPTTAATLRMAAALGLAAGRAPTCWRSSAPAGFCWSCWAST